MHCSEFQQWLIHLNTHVSTAPKHSPVRVPAYNLVPDPQISVEIFYEPFVTNSEDAESAWREFASSNQDQVAKSKSGTVVQ